MQTEKVNNIWKQPENNSGKEIDRRKVLAAAAAGGLALALAGCKQPTEAKPVESVTSDGGGEKPSESPSSDDTKESQKPVIEKDAQSVELDALSEKASGLIAENLMVHVYDENAPENLVSTYYHEGTYIHTTSPALYDPEDPETSYRIRARYDNMPDYPNESGEGEGLVINVYKLTPDQLEDALFNNADKLTEVMIIAEAPEVYDENGDEVDSPYEDVGTVVRPGENGQLEMYIGGLPAEGKTEQDIQIYLDQLSRLTDDLQSRAEGGENDY